MNEFKMSLMSAILWLETDHVADPACMSICRLMRRLHDHLECPLRIVVLGEANSGKSTLVNLLIGANMAPTSVVANTLRPVIFKYADCARVCAVLANGERRDLDIQVSGQLTNARPQLIEVGLPLERLRLLEVVDTPGTENAQIELDPWEVRYRIGDLLVWCTVATQAWKESERRTWSGIASQTRSNGLLAVTRIDQLPNPSDVAAVRRRLAFEVESEFGSIVLLSLPDALAASGGRQGDDSDELWRRSGGEDLENMIALAVLQNTQRRISRAKQALAKTVQRLLTGAAGISGPLLAQFQPGSARLLPDGFQPIGVTPQILSELSAQ
jgi:GTPase SAR1 family protein